MIEGFETNRNAKDNILRAFCDITHKNEVSDIAAFGVWADGLLLICKSGLQILLQ